MTWQKLLAREGLDMTTISSIDITLVKRDLVYLDRNYIYELDKYAVLNSL